MPSSTQAVERTIVMDPLFHLERRDSVPKPLIGGTATYPNWVAGADFV